MDTNIIENPDFLTTFDSMQMCAMDDDANFGPVTVPV